MKAVIVDAFGPIENARVCEVADPHPGSGEVVVGVKAAEVNFPDIMVVEGTYQNKPPLPFSPGKAAAGIVEEVGQGVTSLQPGDRVAVQTEYGAYAEKLKTSAANCYSLPEQISFEQGAALGLAFQTSYFALVERANIQKGDNVLVLGASGGVGIAAVQIAKALGAGNVIGGVWNEEKAEIVRKAGADYTIDLRMEDLRDEMRATILKMTDGYGVDIVIDPVGGAANAAALRSMAWCGRMIIVGFASGDIPVIKSNYILVKNILVSGLHWSDYRERDPAWVARVQGEIFTLFLEGKLDPQISRTFSLEHFAVALSLLKEGKSQGKLVLTMSE